MKQHRNSELSDMDPAENTLETCINSAIERFHGAFMSGLCAKGTMKTAIWGFQILDVEKVIQIRD